MTLFEKAARLPARQPYLFHVVAAVAIVMMSFGIYRETFSYGYLDWDDNTLVEQNPYVIQPPYGQHALDLFVPGRTIGPHLPVRTATYIFDREVLGAGAPLYVAPNDKTTWTKPNYHHLTNVFLYALDGLILLWLLRKLLPPWAAAIATLVWVAHPLHAEGVCWVSGRKEMLTAAFVFGSFLSYLYAVEDLGEKESTTEAWLAALIPTVVAGIITSIAIFHPLTDTAFVNGLVSLGLLGVSAFAYSAVAGGDKWKRAGALLFLSTVLALGGALSKPVAVAIYPILFAWEVGFRPRRAAAATFAKRQGEPPHTGLYGTLHPLAERIRSLGRTLEPIFISGRVGSSILMGLVASPVLIILSLVEKYGQRASAAAGMGEINPLVSNAISGAVLGVGLGLVIAAVRQFLPAVERVCAEPARAVLGWLRSEFGGVWGRSFPQVALAFWAAYITMGLAVGTQVLKSETWNSAPKSQSLASYSALWLDVYHLIAPLELSALYDVKSDGWFVKSSLFGFDVTWSPALAGIVILIALPIAIVWLLRRNPRSLLWLFFWGIPLIPVSGIVRIASAHADRYLFLPVVALAVALGVLLATAAFGTDEETGPWERLLAAGLAVVIIGGFSVLSYKRMKIWGSNETLWGDAVAKNPDLPSARNNYGAALMNAGKAEAALEQYYASYRLQPSLDVAQFNIAATEMRFRRFDVAEKYAKEFNAQHKEMPTGWVLLGQIHAAQAGALQQQGASQDMVNGKIQEAVEAYNSGCNVPVDKDSLLQLADRANACNQLGVAKLNLTPPDEEGAYAAWMDGLKAQPNNRTLLISVARWWRSKKDFKKSLDFLLPQEQAGDPEILRNLAQTYYEMGDDERAQSYIQQVLQSGRAVQRDVDNYRMISDRAARRAKGEIVPDPLSEPAPGAKRPTPTPTAAAKATPKASATPTPKSAAVATGTPVVKNP